MMQPWFPSAKLVLCLVLFCCGFTAPGRVARAAPPTPRDVLGFAPGEDRKLANWNQYVSYFRQLDAASERVVVREIGKTTLGRPFLLTVFSSPANLARLDRYQEIQRLLADPRTLQSDAAAAARLIAEGKTIVLITGGIHSTEVGANLVGLNLAHRLATDDSPATREILDNCVVLLVPSLNPDGVDIVTDWYKRTLNTPAEGTNPPTLYHHYTGHDNNRDWYAFTQQETRLTIDHVHNVWHPQIVHDIHQQGTTGSRLFLPPYLEPWEPNVPPLIQAGVNALGSAIAWEMAAQNKPGVVTYDAYDAWTPARAYQHYHGGVRILSETASARLATPITLRPDQLNTDVRTRSWNFPLPWPGGTWRLQNIVDYMETAAFALLGNAARARASWLSNFYQIGKEAVRARRSGEPFAFLLPPGDAVDSAARAWQERAQNRLDAVLLRGGVEIARAPTAFLAGGARYPAGTRIIFLAQPYGAFAKTLLERQTYPDLRRYPGGPPTPPYDVTAHTLPLLLGTPTPLRVDVPFALSTRAEPLAPPPAAPRLDLGVGGARLAVYQGHVPVMDEGWTRWILDDGGVPYTSLGDAVVRAGGLRAKYDAILLPSQSPASLFSGQNAALYPAELAGGLGEAGVAALARFVEEGGTLIAFSNACNFVIERLGLPVRNVLKNVPGTTFFCPGSILKIVFDKDDPLARGAPPLDGKMGENIAWLEDGPVFEPTGAGVRVVARYPSDPKQVLLSGWLLGADQIAGKGALVTLEKGAGRVVLFGFRPQYRGQSLATLPLLLNAVRSSNDR